MKYIILFSLGTLLLFCIGCEKNDKVQLSREEYFGLWGDVFNMKEILLESKVGSDLSLMLNRQYFPFVTVYARIDYTKLDVNAKNMMEEFNKHQSVECVVKLKCLAYGPQGYVARLRYNKMNEVQQYKEIFSTILLNIGMTYERIYGFKARSGSTFRVELSAVENGSMILAYADSTGVFINVEGNMERLQF